MTRHALPRGRPFAWSGTPRDSPRRRCRAISAEPAADGARDVRNASDVPQYGLPVYALARRGGRYVAAGRATLQQLGTGDSATVPLRLIGAAPWRAARTRSPADASSE